MLDLLRRRQSHAAPRNAPLVLERRPRGDVADWYDSRSWFGGLPRLGDREWPMGPAPFRGGSPMHFVAQFDLAAVARLRPGNGLPERGSLAVFLGLPMFEAGWNDEFHVTLLHVEEEVAEVTPLPPYIRPVFGQEWRYHLPWAQADDVPPATFPYWPIDIVDPGRDRSDPLLIPKAYSEARGTRGSSLRANGDRERLMIEPNVPCNWRAVRLYSELLTTRLQSALGSCKHDRYSRFVAGDPHHKNWKDHLAQAHEYGHPETGFPPIIAEMFETTVGRDPWAALTGSDLEWFAPLVMRAKQLLELGSVSRDECWLLADANLHVIHGMAVAPPEVFARLPRSIRAMVSEEKLQPHGHHHMFGLGWDEKIDLDEHGDDAKRGAEELILHLAFDEIIAFGWGDLNSLSVWMPREAIRERAWDAARITMEGL